MGSVAIGKNRKVIIRKPLFCICAYIDNKIGMNTKESKDEEDICRDRGTER